MRQLLPNSSLLHLISRLAFVPLCLILASCSTSTPVQKQIRKAPTITEVYKIGVGDQLEINVWRNEELSGTVPVRPDGMISTPLAGDVIAAGLTAEQLASNITEILATYLKTPKVTVIVSNPGSTDFQRRVRITGAVNSPQSIAFRDGMTVLDLVLLAEGPNDYAALSRAKLYRRTGSGVEVYDINLDDLLNRGKLEANYPLQPSDQITVPERRF
ncbi:polysaccharide biosynthesis/export family protein [Porticoccus sp. W117]|uniref:XrtA/PEP-CTERM system exopolysaccharide export protein n=1 Tax=Porticoccus sp. W117 TaxID=3054777 RepID=UPI002592A68F|nr:XrtA/PEP-CTERM system exopolysaccharide export protein [Porticoccus sp. W117]MDM3870603.1 polysaccharide biosynthesis/export family protein [Porticoccus sp. W117]